MLTLHLPLIIGTVQILFYITYFVTNILVLNTPYRIPFATRCGEKQVDDETKKTIALWERGNGISIQTAFAL